MNIRFDFVLNQGNDIAADLINQRDYVVVARIEGRLEIYLDTALFFREEYICLLEFGIDLTKWLDAVRTGVHLDMNYDAMDHHEPVIQFFYKGDESWRIHSIWQEFEPSQLIQMDSLTMAVREFLDGLDVALKEAYGIKVHDFLVD